MHGLPPAGLPLPGPGPWIRYKVFISAEFYPDDTMSTVVRERSLVTVVLYKQGLLLT